VKSSPSQAVSLSFRLPPHPNTIGSRRLAEKKCFSGTRFRCAYLTSEVIEMFGDIVIRIQLLDFAAPPAQMSFVLCNQYAKGTV